MSSTSLLAFISACRTGLSGDFMQICKSYVLQHDAFKQGTEAMVAVWQMLLRICRVCKAFPVRGQFAVPHDLCNLASGEYQAMKGSSTHRPIQGCTGLFVPTHFAQRESCLQMRCRTFNATAGGYMRGDGCGALRPHSSTSRARSRHSSLSSVEVLA